MTPPPANVADPAAALAARNRVFASLDPYDSPFQPDVSARRLLFPVSPEYTTNLLEPLFQAASEIGDSGAYLTYLRPAAYLSCDDAKLTYEPTFSLSLDVGAYVETVRSQLEGFGSCPSALYGMCKNWGVLSSDEVHALVGGPPAFIERWAALGRHSPDDLTKFQAYWRDTEEKGGNRASWMNGLLRHLGESTASAD